MKKTITFVILFLCMIPAVAQLVTTPGEYTIKNLDINTKESDFGTAFLGKDKVIFAAPTTNTMIIRKTWAESGQQFLDLYTGLITEDRQVIQKKNMPGDVNTKYHEAGVSVTKDLKTIYYTANNYYEKQYLTDSSGVNNLQLFRASLDLAGNWIEKEKLPFNDDEYSLGHPALSHDDSKLYFVSDMPGGYGQTDIYVVDIREDGSFGEVRNLGPKINTKGREMFPYIDKDNVLYFSSDTHPGYGKLDVFASKIFDTTVSTPLNLEEPVNSVDDDFAFIIDDERDRGFYSSNREEGKGDDDIYSFLANPGLYIHCDQEISGFVRSESSQEPIAGATVELRDESGEVLQTVTSGSDGSYSFDSRLCNSPFVVVGMNKGYLNDERAVRTVNDIDVGPLRVDLNLPDQFVSNKVNINTIYFDFDKYNIRPDAAKELDKVVQVMNEYPELLIEAGSHTDSRGRDKYNQKLSEKRAKATVDYIVSKGIDASRLTFTGYGETRLVNDCADGKKCSEEEHQLNRRTEFTINNESGFELVPSPQ
jgi:outer membrane protein OmpA-like peptidoglycan-associated protein